MLIDAQNRFHLKMIDVDRWHIVSVVTAVLVVVAVAMVVFAGVVVVVVAMVDVVVIVVIVVLVADRFIVGVPSPS